MTDGAAAELRHSKRTTVTHTPLTAKLERIPLREVLVAAAGASLLIAAVFGWYATKAGFIRDDWIWGARYLNDLQPGGVNAVLDLARENSRTLYFLIHGLRMLAFGLDPHAQLAVTLLSSVVLATFFYWFLRRFGMAVWEAAAITALSTVFPLADSVRLFATGAVNPLATAAVLAGVLIALRGLTEVGVRRWSLRATSLVCMAAAPLIYESAIPFACVSYFAYRRETVRRTAALWWIGDVVTTIGVTAIARAVATTHEVSSYPLSEQLRHVVVIAGEAVGVFAFSLIPQFTQIITARLAVAVTAAAGIIVVVTAVAAVRLAKQVPDSAATLSRWLRVALWAAGAAAVGYLAFVPGSLSEYHPLARGEGTRINVSVALPMAVLTFSFVQILATVVAFRIRRPERQLRIAQILTSLLLVGYVATVAVDEHRWLDTSRNHDTLVSRLDKVMPRNQADFTVFVRGKADLASPGIPGTIEDTPLGIGPEIAVPLRRPGISAFLLSPTMPLHCHGGRVVSSGSIPAQGPAARTYEYQADTGSFERVRTCHRT